MTDWTPLLSPDPPPASHDTTLVIWVIVLPAFSCGTICRGTQIICKVLNYIKSLITFSVTSGNNNCIFNWISDFAPMKDSRGWERNRTGDCQSHFLHPICFLLGKLTTELSTMCLIIFIVQLYLLKVSFVELVLNLCTYSKSCYLLEYSIIIIFFFFF